MRPFSFDDPLPLPPLARHRQEAILAELESFPRELLGRYEDRSYISPSQIKMADRCLEQFRRRYVLGEKEPPSANLVWGRADHSAIEHNFREKMGTGEDVPVPEVRERFAASLDEEVERDGGVTEIVWDDKRPYLTASDARKELATVQSRGLALVSCYREHVAPAVTPLAIEESFSVEVEGVPLAVEGRIDLIGSVPSQTIGVVEETVRNLRTERIIERKTTAQRRVSGEWVTAARVCQLARPLEVDFHLSVKTKTPSAVAGEFLYPMVPAEMIVAKVQRTVATIGSCYRLYGPDQPWPDAIGSAWACNYCGFRKDCPWWVDARWAS